MHAAGMSPQGLSLVFGCISLGLVAAAQAVLPAGLSQFVFGAVAAPLVGIAGDQTALPLGIVTTAVSVCAMASFVSLVIPVVRARV